MKQRERRNKKKETKDRDMIKERKKKTTCRKKEGKK
jgi:hypothetical protein